MRFLELNCFLIFSFLLLLSCKEKTVEGLIHFDVARVYPEKVLYIQDIADVEYLCLETHDDYLFSYFSHLSESYVICENRSDDSFVFFNRTTGKPVSKVDRYGNGPGEYIRANVSLYSEEKDELFILDLPNIKVYSKEGVFKRQFPFRQTSYIGAPDDLHEYEDNLLFYDSFRGNINDYPTAFVMISKQDGQVTKEIDIPYEKKIKLMFSPSGTGGGVFIGEMPLLRYSVRNGNDYLLTEYYSDTVYRFTPEHVLTPVLVRTPSIQTMEPKIILNSWLESEDFLFFSTQKLEVDWEKREAFPKKGYLMEKNSGIFFQSDIRMKDYEGKELTLEPLLISRSLKDSRTAVIVLTADELSEAHKEERLSGELKEIAGRLTIHDELILMILKF